MQQDIIEDYLASCGELRITYAGMTRDQLLGRPVEGKWSALEVLCHLVDTDLLMAMRIRAALQKSSPRHPAATSEELTARLAVEARDAAEELSCFEIIRAQTSRIVRFFPAGSLDRDVVLVKARGEDVRKTVREMLVGITGHVRHHLPFLLEKRKAMGLVALET